MASVDRSEAVRCTQDVVKYIVYLADVSVCCVEAAAGPHVYVLHEGLCWEEERRKRPQAQGYICWAWLKDFLFTVI